ncbi:MAG: hypothetical protein QOI59_1191 [Gammaproteobacteria bacterium]|jgi:hypothetical protein|nr:hypothetical protein [Gammaproteobacteria bacterium]
MNVTDPGDIVQQAIKLQLQAAGVDTSTIAVEVRKTTAVLTGTITDAGTRRTIVEALFGLSTIDQVVDALSVGGEHASPQIYMKDGEPLTRAIRDLFDPNVSWKQYRAAKKRGSPT